MNDNFGFSIDSTVKTNYDSTIRTEPPKMPLSRKEQEYLFDNSFSYFHYRFKTRHFGSKCLEHSEYQEYFSNKDFMTGRAYVFFMRTMSIFDKSFYELPPIGIITKKQSEEEVTDYEVECLIRFKLVKKKKEVYYLDSIALGVSNQEIIRSIRGSKKISTQVKKLVAITRLSVYWRSRYEFYIGRLIAEIVRNKQKKALPPLRQKGASKKDLKNYSDSMKGADENPCDSDVDFDFTSKDSSISKVKELFETGDFSDMPFDIKRYIYCSQHLEMSNSELIIEFGESLPSIKKELEWRVNG